MKLPRSVTGLILVFIFFFAGLYGGPVIRSAYVHIFPYPAYQSGDYSTLYAQAHRTVVLFSTSTCPYCRKVRELLDATGVSYADFVVDTSKDAKEKFAVYGGGAVPVIYLGDRKIIGFREDAIRDALKNIPGTPGN